MIPFIAKQEQLEAKLSEWRELAGPALQVEHIRSYSGYPVYALTLSDFSVPRSGKKALYVAQPHAHEPATTAGMADVIEQLITGRDLAGNPSKIDREKVLAGLVVTFNPIGNPFGRQRAPRLYYDGSEYGPEPFRCLIFGEDPERPGKPWKRVDVWDRRKEQAPDPIGIVYEPIDAFRYVEPNRCRQSSYFKLFQQMDAIHRYDHWLDLHQMMFIDSQYEDTGFNCQVLLPIAGHDEIYAQKNKMWADAITAVWRDRGFAPAQPRRSGYTGEQADYFRRTYRDIHERMSRITVEGVTNRRLHPVDVQVRVQSAAIEASLAWLLD